MPSPHDTKPARDISTNDIRGGVTGNGVRYVLAFSLGGAIIVMIGLYYYFFVYP